MKVQALPPIIMEIHEVEKQKMEVIQALATVNMKVSEAKGLLSKLEEQETEYLIEREARVMARIGKVLEESQQAIIDAHGNYAEKQKVAQSLSDFVTLLVETCEKFEKMREAYDEKTIVWENKVKTDETRLAELQRLIKVDGELLKEGKDALDRRENKLKQMERKITDDRGVIEREIKRLKEGRI